jgi:predicted esterase
MKELRIDFAFKARYYKLGEINKETRRIWFVLHGYGQLARFFIQKFSILEKNKHCVIAPEGLSRFYLEDIPSRMSSGNNRVGATWMTRENRLMDIENYLEYLTQIQTLELVRQPNIPVTLLGFSQGAATASRWALDPRIRFDQLVLWAGILPPDMDFEKGKSILANKKVIVVFGDQDPLVTEKHKAEMNVLCLKLSIRPEIIEFTGGHDIDEATLFQINPIS